MALLGGGLIRLFNNRRKAGFPLIKAALGAAKDRLIGDDQGNKGVLQSRTTIGVMVTTVTGALAAFNVEIGDEVVRVWTERLYYIGMIIGLVLSWTGRNKAETPLAGSDVAERRAGK